MLPQLVTWLPNVFFLTAHFKEGFPMPTVDSLQSPASAASATFMRHPRQNEVEDADVVVVVPFDSGALTPAGVVSDRRPARSLHHSQTLPCALDVDINRWLAVADYGDIDTIPGYGGKPGQNPRRADPLVSIPDRARGAGREPLPSVWVLRAIKAAFKPSGSGAFDAHSDTIPATASPTIGTPFYHALKEGLIRRRALHPGIGI